MEDEKTAQPQPRYYRINCLAELIARNLKLNEIARIEQYTHNGTRVTYFVENKDPKNDNERKYKA